jgi:hypothetical protein
METNTYPANIKILLLTEAADTKYGTTETDRSNWEVATAKKDIKHRGVLVLAKGEPVLYNPDSFRHQEVSNRKLVTVYLARNLGGVNTSRYASEFTFK